MCTSSCACDADPSDFSEELQETMVTDSFGESKLLDCPYSTMTTAQINQFENIMTVMEEQF